MERGTSTRLESETASVELTDAGRIVSVASRNSATQPWCRFTLRDDTFAMDLSLVVAERTRSILATGKGRVEDGNCFLLQADMAAIGLAASGVFSLVDKGLSLELSLKNSTTEPVVVDQLIWATGIDSYMDKHPEWLTKNFPINQKAERTHFRCFAGSPSGPGIGLLSADPIHSWCILYSNRNGGHRIWSLNVNLIDGCNPLPDRFNGGSLTLQPGQTTHRHLIYTIAASWEAFRAQTAEHLGVPIVSYTRSGGFAGTEATSHVNLPTNGDTLPTAKVIHLPTDQIIEAQIAETEGNGGRITFPLPATGDYTLEVVSGGKSSTTRTFCHEDWFCYLERAARFLIDKGRDADGRFYGVLTSELDPSLRAVSGNCAFTYFGGERTFALETLQDYYRLTGDHAAREAIDKHFEHFWNELIDRQTGESIAFPGSDRICDKEWAIEQCVKQFRITGDAAWLADAERLANCLIGTQAANGAIYASTASGEKIDYSNCVTPAMALFCLIGTGEKVHGDKRFADMRRAARSLCDYLVKCKTDLDTEGEITYIPAPTVVQLALGFLYLGEQRYLDTALEIMHGSECMHWAVPDSRYYATSGGFFWDTYWAGRYMNCITSPHVWTETKIWAAYFLYLATCDAQWIEKAYSAQIAAVQLLHPDTGGMRMCFCPEPFVEDAAGERVPMENYVGEYASEAHGLLRTMSAIFLDKGYVYYTGEGWQGINMAVEADGDRLRARSLIRGMKTVFFNPRGCASPAKLALAPEMGGIDVQNIEATTYHPW